MTEAGLQENIIDLVGYAGGLVYHTHDSRRSEPGFPDLVIVGPHGVLFRELKSATGYLTSEQVRWVGRLKAAGADVTVWRPGDWPGTIINDLRGVGFRVFAPTGVTR